MKIKNQKSKIFGIIGCMAQAMKDGLFKKLPGLNLVCGTGEIARLPELVEKTGNARILAVDNIDKPLPELNPAYRENDRHAYVSIMRGCDNFCSYCIVPFVRGKERSRGVEKIITEVRKLVKKGIREITLLGQNVNSYKAKGCDFVGLLRKINDVDGVEKISFLTSHPKDASIKLFEAVRELDRVEKYLHLPLQSGSDRILRLMRRGYTRKKYLELAEKARGMIPGLRFTTDIITGFPTEREEDFNDTLNVMKKIKFDLAYIFKYSPRPGTEAEKLKDDVPEGVKKKRHKILLDLQKQLSRSRRNEKSNCRCYS